MTFHTSEEVRTLFKQFDVEIFNEIEEEGRTAVGNAKHWHLFAVVAIKR